MGRVAAVDIGSNSILLCIAERNSAGGVDILFDEANVTGLSKGLTSDGKIKPERLEKSLSVLSHYREQIEKFSANEIQIVATEALRRASNGEEVRKQIEQTMRHPVQLISGDREAELSFWSVQKDFADRSALKMVFDIGGASTELCLGNNKGVQQKISLKVGSVVLSEKFGLKDISKPDEASQYVKGLLAELPWKAAACLGFGVAGTITTLLAMEHKISDYSRDKVHGQSISKERVVFWRDQILNRSTTDRAKFIGLTLDRADVFSGGLCIVTSLMEHFNWDKIVCMDSGIRFGLIYEMLDI